MPEAAAALFRPFFFIIKLAPTNPLDNSAKVTPFRLSVEIGIASPPLPLSSLECCNSKIIIIIIIISGFFF